MSVKIDFANVTLMDTLDLATLIEVEAFKRYALLAEQLGSRLADDAGAVFGSMAENEKKHADALVQRRVELFGEAPARVKLDDIFDVEAPDFGSTYASMSTWKAYRLALHSEQKAFAFYDRALRSVTQPEVRALFEELREEEAEHVRMIEEMIAKLPPSSKVDLEDLDDTSMRMGY
jgi:erythrin-vacuolar iron transport family protein